MYISSMAEKPSPLSPTVLSIFTEFLNKVEAEKTLGPAGIEALKHALTEQKFDPESLREAMFTGTGTEQ